MDVDGGHESAYLCPATAWRSVALFVSGVIAPAVLIAILLYTVAMRCANPRRASSQSFP